MSPACVFIMITRSSFRFFFFFFTGTATTEIYTLSLHDALPICNGPDDTFGWGVVFSGKTLANLKEADEESFKLDRKSTRLNSSHSSISYAVFCLKKKKKKNNKQNQIKKKNKRNKYHNNLVTHTQ